MERMKIIKVIISVKQWLIIYDKDCQLVFLDK